WSQPKGEGGRRCKQEQGRSADEVAQRSAHDRACEPVPEAKRAAFAPGETDTRTAAASVEREQRRQQRCRGGDGDERNQQAADPERAHERDGDEEEERKPERDGCAGEDN